MVDFTELFLKTSIFGITLYALDIKLLFMSLVVGLE